MAEDIDRVVGKAVGAIAEDTSGADIRPSAWRDHYCALLDTHIRAAILDDRTQRNAELGALHARVDWLELAIKSTLDDCPLCVAGACRAPAHARLSGALADGMKRSDLR